MKPPTIYELAGIVMLALVAAGLIAHPSTGSHAASTLTPATPIEDESPILIDGIEPFALPPPRDASSNHVRDVRNSVPR
jgi:hypothetical protein